MTEHKIVSLQEFLDRQQQRGPDRRLGVVLDAIVSDPEVTEAERHVARIILTEFCTEAGIFELDWQEMAAVTSAPTRGKFRTPWKKLEKRGYALRQKSPYNLGWFTVDGIEPNDEDQERARRLFSILRAVEQVIWSTSDQPYFHKIDLFVLAASRFSYRHRGARASPTEIENGIRQLFELGYLARADFRQSGDVTEVCTLPAELRYRRNVGGLW